LQQIPFPPSLSASVDWFSASFRDDDNRRMVHQLATVIGENYKRVGLKPLTTTWHGYELTKVGNITYGIRQEDSYIELSSTGAAEWWLSFAPFAHNVARLDLAVTWQPERKRTGLAHGLYREVSRLPDRGHMPPQLRYFETHGGGQTFYVGSNKSARMGRIYDKGAELGDRGAGELWRYEVQLRNAPANVVAKDLVKSNDRGFYIGAAVATFFEQRLCPVAWRTNFTDLPIVVHRPRSSDEVKKRWLSATVRPVMRNLGARVPRSELLSLIGLDELDMGV
jgi:DNA relaxase NicK